MFGHGGSIRNLPVYIANCYQEWIAGSVLKKNRARLEYDVYKDMDALVKVFLLVDTFMSDFLGTWRTLDRKLNMKKMA